MNDTLLFVILMLLLAFLCGAGVFFLLAWILSGLGAEHYYLWAALIMVVSSLITGGIR